MASVTAAEVRRLIGELDDDVVAAVVATGASASDVEEAAHWLAAAEDVEGPRPPPTGRVADVVAVLADALPLPDDDDGREP